MQPGHAGRFGAHQFAVPPLVNEYLTATELTHDWANLTGWTATGVQVSSNRLYGISGGNPVAAGKSFAVAVGETVKVTAEITSVGSLGGAQYVGVNFGGSNDGVNASLPNFVGVGVGLTTRHPQRFVGANFSGVTTGAVDLSTASMTGTCRATVVVDATSISLVVQRQDGTVEYSEIIPRSAAPNGGDITSIIVWNGATNGLSGHYIKAIGAKKSLTPFRTKSNSAGTIEGNTDFVMHRYSGSDNWRIQLPAVRDGMAAAPVAVFLHQATTGTRNSPMTESRWAALRQALMSAGYGLLSADDGGDRWGNPTSVANYRALLDWVAARVLVSKVFLIGCSMGGLPMLNIVSHKQAYPIGAAVGICPVCDLIAMRANPTFTASIDAAWGSSSEATLIANSAGYDPVTSDPYEFRRIPYLFNVGTSDTTVPPAQHADVFLPLIAGAALSTEKNVVGVGHLQPEQYDPLIIMPFLNSHL